MRANQPETAVRHFLGLLCAHLFPCVLECVSVVVILCRNEAEVCGTESDTEGSSGSREEKDPHCEWAQVHGYLPEAVHLLLPLS